MIQQEVLTSSDTGVISSLSFLFFFFCTNGLKEKEADTKRNSRECV